MDLKKIRNGPLACPEPPLTAGLPYTCGKKLRQVGLFYFLWLGEHGRHAPYDISKIVAADPDAGYHPDSDAWGGEGVYHHWGEPLFGYYYSDDEWVVRRHMKLLISAGVDFLFFDTTNAIIYEKNVRLVMRILDEYRRDGWHIPKVMFYTNTASGNTVDAVYHAIYEPAYMPETWFYYEDRPLIIANRADCRPEMLAYFTVREAQWPNEADKAGGWPWMDFTRPQRVFTDFNGAEEVINVSVAQHPQLRFGDSVLYGETGNCGRAFHDGANDPAPNAYQCGYNFMEQFARAIETDPPVVLVTGWNEWIAGRWRGIPERPIMFVDCANHEYSRDIEMMRGGYGDNYYRQLIACIRHYKGTREQAQMLPSGSAIEFFTFADDDFTRNHEGYGTVYVNETARNVPVKLTVAASDGTLTVKVETKAALTPHTDGGAWMELYLSPDAGKTLYVINRTRTANETSVCRLTDVNSLTGTVKIGTVPYQYADNAITFTLPCVLFGINADSTVWLKAADSRSALATPLDFYDTGSTAPVGNLYYPFTLVE